MAGYIDFPFNETQEDCTQRILTGVASRIPGWTPGGEGTLEVALAEEIGREISDLRALTVDVAAAAVRAFGQSLFGVTYLAAAPATLSARITNNAPGLTVPAGFTVLASNVDGDDVAFYLTADAVFASNASNKTVTLLARDAGSLANGVPIGQTLRIATATQGVVSVVTLGVSSGGADAETDESYTNRLVSTLSTLTRTPILGKDFAVRAKDVAGVYRATAIDNYDPDTGATSARTVTVVAVDENGQYVGATIAGQVDALLQSLREANFVVKVTSPTYTAVNVVFAATALPGFDAATVQAAVIARVKDYLDPASWGGGSEDPPVWRNTPVVRYLDLAAAIDRVEGVDYLTSLTINGSAADYTLPGAAPLPSSASTVTGSVVVS